MSFTTEIWKPATPTSIGKKPVSLTAELSHEDDWTKVKDPKEKKRIQNRVAQRTYRHRMKARLGELQARLESHERRSQSADRTDSQTLEESDSPLSHSDLITKIEPGSLPLGQQPLPHPMQQSLCGQSIEAPDNSMFSQPSAVLMHSPPPSGTTPTVHGLLSPPTAGDQQQQQQSNGMTPQQQKPEGKHSQDFMMDCLRFQNQLLGRLNNLQQDAALTGQFVQETTAPISQSEQMSSGTEFATNADGMDFAFETFNQDMKMQPTQAQSPDSAYFTNLAPTGAGTVAPTVIGASMPDALGISAPVPTQPRIPNRNASLDDRFECIMEQVEAAGFDSFDSLVTAYYSQTFKEASPLANEQRLSRNRRLPKVISDVFGATNDWTAWERRGFHEEILKTAESMLTNEGYGARGSLTSKLSGLIDAQDQSNPASLSDALLSMKRSVQDELPNSWALTMALAADNRPTWQRDRSNTALATILLLNFSGRLPNDQLLRLMGACL